jgi:hypothetical protein
MMHDSRRMYFFKNVVFSNFFRIKERFVVTLPYLSLGICPTNTTAHSNTTRQECIT